MGDWLDDAQSAIYDTPGSDPAAKTSALSAAIEDVRSRVTHDYDLRRRPLDTASPDVRCVWQLREDVDTLLATLDAARTDYEARITALEGALVDLTSAYHHERKHEHRWDACQRPRCQNARLAIEGRGPFALLATSPTAVEP